MTAATAAPTHRRQRRAVGPLTGLRSLLRLHLRLARRGILIWTLAVLVLVPASIYAMEDVYPDQAALDARATLLDNPSAVMMTGPFFAADHYTFWAMVANELLLYLLVPAAIMSILLTARLTRGEEESGRLELLRSLPTGRLAPSVSALLVVALANLALGAAVASGMLIGGGGASDSLALGLATALTGLVFGAVTAVTAQLTEHAGTASGTALGILALSFMVRGIGDVIERDGSWLSWFSPLAWAQQTRAFVDLRWWPLLVSLAAVAVLLVIAGRLSHRRDLGAGLRPAAAGRAAASAALLAPGGLTRRLVGGTHLAWGIGLFLFALAFGSLASSLTDFAENLPDLAGMAPIRLDDLTGSFSAFVLMMLAIGPVALAVSGMLRMRTEETAGRLAGVLVAGTSRARLAGQWFLVVLLGTAAMQVLLGLGVGIGVWSATEDTAWIGEMTLAALTYLPAVALYAAIALALYGLGSRLAPLAWLLVVYTALVTFLGQMLGLPDWAMDLSPLQHIALVPSEDLEVMPLVVMGVTATALALLGLALLRRRDLAAG
ncbi:MULTISPECIES: ABC transporter permease [Brachybacterium]|uniref:Polyketide antibiotic transporter n=2 Tax=Brachybacterium TaxID=43668 RepID=A0A426SMX1_9MICO|nr:MULTISPECIES: polyketide antibiotic transporter [Brachybacterium]RRR19642.1 polyketide antibiotic transporter [Brachybacterium paraconglomeratum]GLI31316.1 exporter of polyketide antibiotics [Brachybacterium conglomeratum]GLK04228.1 exporter of polyketide antibiotics [Brachybacterium conglomeratum]